MENKAIESWDMYPFERYAQLIEPFKNYFERSNTYEFKFFLN